MPPVMNVPTEIDNILAAATLDGKDDTKLSKLYNQYSIIEKSLGKDPVAINQFYQTAKEILHPSILDQIKNYFTEIFYGHAS